MHYFLIANLLVFSLSGCAEIQKAAERIEQQQQSDTNRKASVLIQGTSIDAVKAVWGSPSDASFYSGASTVERLQYGQCSSSLYVKSGVIFITFVDGKLSSYSIVHC